jgi:transposase
VSTQKDYLRCLEQLAVTPPQRPIALIRSLLPGIEGAVRSGQNLKGIWEALQSEGLQVSYHTFYMVVWRARRKRTAPSSRGKKPKPSEVKALREAVEERDPLANLKRLEEGNRPGFHWRSKQDLKTMVHGTDVSSDKNNRLRKQCCRDSQPAAK